MVDVVRVRMYSQSDLAATSAVNGPEWLSYDPGTIEQLQYLSNEPTMRASMAMPLDLVFSRKVTASKKGSKLGGAAEEELNSWLPEVRRILEEIFVYGVGIGVITVDGKISSIALHSVKLQYYYSSDQTVHYRLVLQKDDFSLNTVVVSNPVYQHTSEKEMMTEKERMMRARFFLFVVRKPNPQKGSGGVESNVRTIAYSESFARIMILSATVSAIDGARTSMALESKEVQIESKDANLNRDFSAFSDRSNRALDDNDRISEHLRARMDMQRQAGERHYADVSDTMTAQDEADLNAMYDPVTRTISRHAMKITRKVPLRILPLPPGTTLQQIPMNTIPPQILQEAIAKYSTDVANISGVPASLMAADGSRTNMNVTEAQWNRFYTTCMSRQNEATVVLKTFFIEIFGKETVIHTTNLIWKKRYEKDLKDTEDDKKKDGKSFGNHDTTPPAQYMNPLDVTTLALAKLANPVEGSSPSVTAAEKRMGVWSESLSHKRERHKRAREEDDKKKKKKNTKRHRSSSSSSSTTTKNERNTPLGEKEANDVDRIRFEMEQRKNHHGPEREGVDEQHSDDSDSDDDDEEDDDDDHRRYNVDDFEDEGDDSFDVEYDEYAAVTITFAGVLDNSELLNYVQLGYLKFDALSKLVFKDRLNLPEEFIPDEPLDPITGLSAAEMYIQQQSEQTRQFDADVKLQAATGGGKGGGGAKGGSGAAAPKPKPIPEKKVNKMLGAGASPSKASGLRNQLGGAGGKTGETRDFGKRASRFDDRK